MTSSANPNASTGVLVVGEALVDHVDASGVIRRHVGGSPANVAVGLGRLGQPVLLHTAIGTDSDGQLIRAHLGASGVTVTEQSTVDAPTSRASAELADDGSATYEFAVGWEPRDLPDLAAPTIIHTGSIAAFMLPGADTTAALVARGRRDGALISFDPNIRPGLITDWGDARTRILELIAASHLVKLSDEDANLLFPAVRPGDVLRLVLEAGASIAVITEGDRGARLASGDEEVTVPAVRTAVVDTVGAGDSFTATLIRGLIVLDGGWHGRRLGAAELRSVGAFAARAAAMTVSRPGADPPTLDEIRNDRPAS